MFQRNEEKMNDPISPILIWDWDVLPNVSGPYIQMEMRQSTEYPHHVNQDMICNCTVGFYSSLACKLGTALLLKIPFGLEGV